jgi:hypothetical protein
MKKISDQQQKDLDALYRAYYTYLCEYELGHPFVPYDEKLGWKNQFQWYHKNDFRQNIEEEAHSIKVQQGY